MKELKFRTLRADEIEVRPACVKDGYATLLLYIDSRAVVNLLNETVGAMNWTMDFYEANGKLVGKLGIWDEDKNMFIYKCDTGSESNIEAEKGLFSDCYKRCLSRWGVQELYTAPNVRIKTKDNYMTYSVSEIRINNERNIDWLVIVDKYGKEVFSWYEGAKPMKKDYNDTVNDTDLEYQEEEQFSNHKFTQKDFVNWCVKKKNEGVDEKQIKRFFEFWTSPSKYVEGKKTFEAVKGGFNVEDKWKAHISKAS